MSYHGKAKLDTWRMWFTPKYATRKDRRRLVGKRKKSNVYKVCQCGQCRSNRRAYRAHIHSMQKKIRRDGIENVKLGFYTD